MAFWILQLSDLHFGAVSHWHQLATQQAANVSFDEIRGALKAAKMVEKFDVVLFSGDFTWGRATGAEYRRGFDTALALANRLLEEKYCARKGLMMLPGNHDIVWPPLSPDPTSFHTREEAEQHYTDLLRAVFAGDQTRLRDDLGYGDVFRVRDIDYVFLTLNSSRIETRERAGAGYVGYCQIYSLLEHAALLAGRTNRPYVGIAALHHHLLPIESLRLRWMLPPAAERKFSFVTDAIDTLRALLEAGFSLALHGHLHMPFHYMYSEPEGTGGGDPVNPVSLVISCAGSFGIGVQSKNIAAPHQFQAIEIDEHFIRIHSFEASLRHPGAKRNWAHRVIQFPAPETFNRNTHTCVPLWQLCNTRLKINKAIASGEEFERFEDCLRLEALRRGYPKIKELIAARVRAEQERLITRALERFDEALAFAVATVASDSERKRFYDEIDHGGYLNLVDKVIYLMNDWRG